MIISQQLEQYAQKVYHERLPFFGRRRKTIEHAVESCPLREKVLIKFLYGTMPLSDAGKYDFPVFYSFVSHGLMLADTLEWCRELPEDIFLHYVLYYRINSESIENCRPFFYDQLLPRIDGLSVQEAALEINYWCAENGSYEASDSRTISPLTFYRSGKGRCGEESVFAVTAFRSVGIPARQVYTPRWAHCDDNHAWVEIYINGAWHYLGACEPEECLDKGWFSHASSRALFIHSLTFSNYTCTASQLGEYIGRDGQVYYYNHTAAYAKVRRLEILVQDTAGNPVSHALVLVEIFNMAEYSCGASLFTDNEGKTSITLGLGDVHLYAEKDGCSSERVISVRHTDFALLLLPKKNTDTPLLSDSLCLQEGKLPLLNQWKEFTIEAPQDSPIHLTALTREQKNRNRKRLNHAKKLRNKRAVQYIPESLLQTYPKEAEIFQAAAGNIQEIISFLFPDNSPDRLALLHHLSIKDAKDLRACVLNAHINAAAPYREKWEQQKKQNLYMRYLLSPRIYLEELTDYRSYIQSFFSKEEQEHFRKYPAKIWQYIRQTIKNHEDMDYATLCSTPESCLELSHGSLLNQKILFVAICRTLGIPSRINEVTMQAEWYPLSDEVRPCSNGTCVYEYPEGYTLEGFISVEKEEKAAENPAILTLVSHDPTPWRYFQHWTIGRLTGCRFITLDYSGKILHEGKTELFLEPGTYRLLAANRLPNGNQKAAQYQFTINAGQKKEIVMHQFSYEEKDILASYKIEDFEVTLPASSPLINNKERIPLSSLLKEKINLLAFLQEGEEPTEHILNELLEQSEYLQTADLPIIFVLKNQEALANATLHKVLTRFPQINTVYGDFDEFAESVARQLYVEPEKFPLLALLKPEMEAIYASSGYQAGIISMLLRISSAAFSVPI